MTRADAVEVAPNRPAPTRAPKTPSGVYMPRSTHITYRVDPKYAEYACFCRAAGAHLIGHEAGPDVKE